MHSPIPGVPNTKKTLGRGYPVPYFKDSPGPLSFLNSSEFVDSHRTVPRSRWTAGDFRILIFLPRGEECGESSFSKEEKMEDIFLSNLPLLEGNMFYLISILVVEYLDCQYRWEFRATNPNLMRYVGIKFVLLLCTWFALWAIFELY